DRLSEPRHRAPGPPPGRHRGWSSRCLGTLEKPGRTRQGTSMEDQSGGADVGALIASLAKRSEFETQRLVSLLRHRSWPGGVADRTEPAALEWVRRWGPSRLRTTP